ncbi:putative lipid-binding transport protein (Tim44 family) [Microbacterium endophyticum]|uniref:Putative lipid-binding transport protein (Tim44 family) n=1 Tax=Microbacterium endophyticum TaxID=1526412 RepID=A0A7W4V102_9MICO|nr:general stress protein [Microbacterium endophyticum]MBB2974774.1 putative lipid-binding transport protein (Tim44 family) [Microbacterium endophyticum]NIK37071.1 putative lipid-binding transport protein (Tim44 family) [Microbacterium endophyticum]
MTISGGYPPARGEVGDTIASYPSYEAAQKAVSSLIAGEVPAKQIAIVGNGLRSVERVTGRLGYAAAARSGALNGLLLGLLFSFIFVLGDPAAPIQAFAGVLLVGIAIGMLLSIITYSFLRRRRDFASVMQIVADSYDVTVAPTSVQRARQVLSGNAVTAASGPNAATLSESKPQAARPSAPAPSNVDSEPPRYGERITPPVSQDTTEGHPEQERPSS